jgi:hypothetical protein
MSVTPANSAAVARDDATRQIDLRMPLKEGQLLASGEVAAAADWQASPYDIKEERLNHATDTDR